MASNNIRFSKSANASLDRYIVGSNASFDDFLNGIEIGARDIDAGWQDLAPYKKRKLIEEVRDEAFRRVVGKQWGGTAATGVSKSKFDRDFGVVLKIMEFHVSKEIAEEANRNDLRRARRLVEEVYANEPCGQAEKMAKAWEAVKAEKARETADRDAALVVEANKRTTVASVVAQDKHWLDGHFAFPNPARNEGSDLCEETIKATLRFLRNRDVREALTGNSPAAQTLNVVLSVLSSYEASANATKAVAAA